MSSTTTTTVTTQAAPSLNVKSQSTFKSSKLIEKIHHIPEFTDKYAERKWAKEHMAAAFRVFAKMGFNDGAGGHISLRDPVRPDCFWISEFYTALFDSDGSSQTDRPIFDALRPDQSKRLDSSQ